MKENRVKGLLLVLLCCCLLDSSLQQSDHSLALYDGPGGSGSWLLVNNYVSNLQNEAFNDIASSVCVIRGIWLLYENPNYNTGFSGESGYFWGENFCQDLPPSLSNLVSSVRYGGSPFNFKDDGLNIYQGEKFQGNEVFVSNNLPDIAPYSGSLIVTGVNSWTLYDQPNYLGYHVCVMPADLTYAYPGFYLTSADFGFSQTYVRSARKGCWSSQRYTPRMKTEPGEFYRSKP